METINNSEEIKADFNMFSIAFVHGDVCDLGMFDLDRLVRAGLIEPAHGQQAYKMTEEGQRVRHEMFSRSDGKASV